MRYSVLDLSPIPEGSQASDAFANSIALAKHVEALGYHRFWLAEHHNMEGIASAATSVLIGRIAVETTRMRIGAGGIMLPNHSPLTIAEQFGTLETLFPGRIDLGLGRAPGGDHAVARALRRYMPGADNFPQDVVELMSYFEDVDPNAAVKAVPGGGTHVPVWMLGSSLFGAQLAAELGLPYAFASHFAPAALEQAITVYRGNFKPSEAWPKPHFMLAINVVAADSDKEAAFWRSSVQQAFARLMSGSPGKLPKPVENVEALLGPQLMQGVNQALSVSAVGSKESVRSALGALIDQHQPDEVILTGQIFDQAARRRSFEIAAEALEDLANPAFSEA